MPKARRVSAVVGAFALTAAAAVVSAGTAVSASAATSTTHASKAPDAFVPGVLHAGRATSQPPTTADCEAAFQVACYEPGQIQTAYNLRPLYQRGVTGRGQTIVIVDSFGSPTIQTRPDGLRPDLRPARAAVAQDHPAGGRGAAVRPQQLGHGRLGR